jgi:hypothetical protein
MMKIFCNPYRRAVLFCAFTAAVVIVSVLFMLARTGNAQAVVQEPSEVSVRLTENTATAQLTDDAVIGVVWESATRKPLDVKVTAEVTNPDGTKRAREEFELAVDGDARPGKAFKQGTEGYFTTDAKAVQVWISGDTSAVRNAKLQINYTTHRASDEQITAPSVVKPFAAIAPSISSPPHVHPRWEWGAGEPIDWDPEQVHYRGAVLHHTAGSNDYSADDVPGILRSIWEYHARALQWGDIGYNFLVDKYGGIWEGRKGSLDSSPQGAHAKGANEMSFGVSVLGNYSDAAPSEEAIRAVESIISWKFRINQIDPHGRTSFGTFWGGNQGWEDKPTLIGHRDQQSTACPGNNLYTQLDRIRRELDTSEKQQDFENGVYTITSAIGGKVLDISGASKSDGANAQIWQSNNTNAQKFKLLRLADGTYTLRSVNSGKALDVQGAGVHNGSNVQQFGLNASCAQRWRFLPSVDGYVTITSACSGKALDVSNGRNQNGANVQIWERAFTPAQRWKFTLITKMNTPDIKPGIYSLSSALNGRELLDLAGGKTNKGTNVQIWDSNGSGAQIYRVAKTSDGFYELQKNNDKMAVDVSGASKANGANVQLWNNNYSCAQKWTIEELSGGNLIFFSACSGKVLDVKGGKMNKGTNVQIYSVNYSKAQQWVLKQK